jgi:hypothetical protein
MVYHPVEKQFYLLKDGLFQLYKPTKQLIDEVDLNIAELMLQADDNKVELIKSLA